MGGLAWHCSETSGPSEPEAKDDAGKAPRLVGTWETTGEDPQLGPVRVRMQLRAGGSLRVTLSGQQGGDLVFGGDWRVTEPDTLTLTGPYFRPDGQAQVRCALADTVLVLEDASGATQRWRRLE